MNIIAQWSVDHVKIQIGMTLLLADAYLTVLKAKGIRRD